MVPLVQIVTRMSALGRSVVHLKTQFPGKADGEAMPTEYVDYKPVNQTDDEITRKILMSVNRGQGELEALTPLK